MNRKILALALPNIISNITVPLLGLVDIAIVGHLGDDSLIGGIAIGTAVFNFIYWNFAFLRMGASGCTAQAYGARNFTEIASVFVRALILALAAALLLVVFQRPIGHAVFLLMDGTPHTMSYAADYFYARIWAAPATISMFAFHGWYIGMQNSRFPMYISIGVNVVNLIFCLWFALGLGWGIVGVAWGTVVAQYSGLVLSIILWGVYYRRFLRYIRIRECLKLDALLAFFKINRDIFLRTACIVVVYTFFTSASSGMGDTMLAVNTLLMVSAMAFGIAFAVKLCHIEDFFPTISMVPHHEYWEYALAAAISAMGFSMIFNIQRRLLWVVAIGGILAVCTRNFVNLGPSTDNIGLDMGLVIGSFSGSVLVSLIAVKAVHWFHVPNHVLTIPSVIPMIPGVLMYRMLFGLINMNVTDIDKVTTLMKAIECGVNSGLVIMCISVGVAIPNIFGRKYIASSKNKHLAEVLKERRARGKFVEW